MAKVMSKYVLTEQNQVLRFQAHMNLWGQLRYRHDNQLNPLLHGPFDRPIIHREGGGAYNLY